MISSTKLLHATMGTYEGVVERHFGAVVAEAAGAVAVAAVVVEAIAAVVALYTDDDEGCGAERGSLLRCSWYEPLGNT